ncbi:MAG: shikimate kinase [Candidatus Electrothrix sp. AR3]|nr:shikimate kinase [Candidatus Electrothrix sp. AR3]
MQSNFTLIGMPGAGKSTLGIILAKNLEFGFIDTDVLIQINQRKPLYQIIEENGPLHLRTLEEQELLKINLTQHIIATGGSAVYSEKAMKHLQSISTIIFLEVTLAEINRRIDNFATRGIVQEKHQTFKELFSQRQFLYQRYADITIDCNKGNKEELAGQIAQAIS